MFHSHVHLHRLECIIYSLQETSLPFLGSQFWCWVMNLSTLISLFSWRALKPQRNSYLGGLLLSTSCTPGTSVREDDKRLHPARQTCCTSGSQVALSQPQGCISVLVGGCPDPPAHASHPRSFPGFLPPGLSPTKPLAAGPIQKPCRGAGWDMCRVSVHRKATRFVPFFTSNPDSCWVCYKQRSHFFRLPALSTPHAPIIFLNTSCAFQWATVPTISYFIISAHFPHFYYLPGLCRHLRLRSLAYSLSGNLRCTHHIPYVHPHSKLLQEKAMHNNFH